MLPVSANWDAASASRVYARVWSVAARQAEHAGYAK
jgi:hypothetical protein